MSGRTRMLLISPGGPVVGARQGGAGLLDAPVRHCLVGGHGGPDEAEEQAMELMVGRMLSR
jgi:hypothetical protein